nr:copia protein [Tanacetum cinerariifolium]
MGFQNKMDEKGIVIRNKARLLAQGHTQEEGIDYDEVFAPVARIKAIRLFLAYASFQDFIVYQMDIKSAFLYGKIELDIMFLVCACARYQVTPKVSHLHACKKQTVVANFTTEAEYVTAASYCGQVLWIQNQLLDYGKNMMLYLKNMVGFKMDFSKEMSYEEIRPLFEEEYNKVQTLFKEVPKIDVERIKAPRKRTRKEKVEKDQTTKKQKGNELEHDNTEKQKLEEQQEAEEHKWNLEIVHDDEDDVFVNVAHLSSKPQTIMDYKIYKEEKKEHF